MLKKVNQNSYGVVEYVATSKEDLKNLLFNHIALYSKVTLITSEGLAIYHFTQENEDVDGVWVLVEGSRDSNDVIITK